MSGGTQYVLMLIAAALVWIAVLVVAALEPRHRPARASSQPMCPCPQGCGRPLGQHVQPYAPLLPSPVIRMPRQTRRSL